MAGIECIGGATWLTPSTGCTVAGLQEAVRSAVPEGVDVRQARDRVRVPTDYVQLLLSPASGISWHSYAERQWRNRANPEVGRRALTDVRRLQNVALEELRPLVSGSVLAGRLDDHQVRNVAMMTAPESPGLCLFDEQGTGKTVAVVAAFDLLVERGEVDVLLVVAPKSMVGEWKVEIDRFTDGLYQVRVLDGSRASKERTILNGAEVFVCNYETVSSMAASLRLLCERFRVVLAVDESFNVKNPDAIRTGAVAELREWCTRAYVLCGTPAPNDASDIVAQASLVDFGHAFGGIALPPDAADRRAVIRARMNASVPFPRNLKNVVLPSLPGKLFTDIEVRLGPQQEAAYERLSGDLVGSLESASDEEFRRDYASFLARRAALLRLCSDPAGVDASITDPSAKIRALDEVLEHLIVQGGDKVVIWSFYRSTLDQLVHRYRHLGVARIDGSVASVEERRAAVNSFQCDPDVRLFIGNPAAAGAGVTLHAARYAVYESMSNQSAHYLQSLDRIHRRGQDRDVEYLTLISPHTVEVTEYQRLKRKAALQADLLGDPESDTLSREMLIAELLGSLREREL